MIAPARAAIAESAAPPKGEAKVDLPVVFDPRVVTGSGGGPDKTILNSPRFFEPLGYRMICGYLTPPNDPGYAEIERKAAKYGAPLVTIPDRGPLDLKAIGSLLKVCREQNVRIWHGHDYKTNALGWALKRFHKMHLVTTVHGWVHHTDRTPLYYKIDKWCLKRYERVYCVSDDLHRAVLELGVPAERAILLENGIDTAEFTRRSSIEAAKAKLGLPADELLVGAVGRLEPEKAFDLLLRALAALRSRGMKLRVVIVGEGSDRPRLEALIRELNLGDAALLPGWQSDVKETYEAMDLFALSSLREGLPNVLLEAMALEVPCVATRIAGIPKLIADGTDGLPVDPGNLDELISALGRLAGSAELRSEFRRGGRATIERRYSFAQRIEKLAASYDELLGRRGGAI